MIKIIKFAAFLLLLFSKSNVYAETKTYKIGEIYYLTNVCLASTIEDYFFAGARAETAVLAAFPACSDFIDQYAERIVQETEEKLEKPMTNNQRLLAKAQAVRKLYETSVMAMKGQK